ncbi:SDR family NAD(P)-dependent oxidoreductase [Glycomyces dulcitolivorans]|uniref:SDR family NAD(P)-dependent oxidoreductase n=1 Tax=Glycomyces dulcitolivorans TaxID=2200759 RepID=UPI000DD41926|nr:SDR family oxidoreductase [Glycomyces dulcitolivorans]
MDNARTGSMAGRVAVVPGGTGSVGEGIVRAFLSAGADVVVPSRSQAKLDELSELIGPELAERLHGVTGAYGTFAEAEQLAETVKERFGRIDHVVPAVGGWWMGQTLWQTSEDAWQRFFLDVTTAHTAVARAFVPRLEAEGSYSMISGFSAQKPYAGAGIVSMSGAALLMMREVLSAELQGQRRVNDLILGPVITRTRPGGQPDWLTADQVGEAAVLVAANPAVADEHLVLDTVANLDRLRKRNQ